MGGSRHGAPFGAGVVHLDPQGRTVAGDLPDRDDLLPVQRHQRVELLHGLIKNNSMMTPLDIPNQCCQIGPDFPPNLAIL